MPLSAVAVTRAKPKSKSYKLTDGRGLYLLVTPKGHRYWRFNYRFDGKYRTLAFGVYPDVTLADARARRDEARRILAHGEEPMARRRQDEREAKITATNTFRLIAEEWVERLIKLGRAEATIRKTRWLLDFAYPTIGDRPMPDITAMELLEVLREIEARGRYETAIRLRGTFGTIFRYAIATGRAERDVAYDLRGALMQPQRTPQPAIIEPKEVGQLLRAIDGYEGQPTVQFAMRLLPHLFVRPGELRHAEWKEFDAEKAVWTIPAHKTKMRRVHRVPLSGQVMDMLDQLERISFRSDYLFPSVRSNAYPISDNTLNATLRKLGYDKTQMTAHGFRAMAATLLNEMGKWHPDAIERQLGHVENNSIRRAYVRGEHWDERVRMMQEWSDYLDRLRDGARVITGRFGRTEAAIS